MDYTEALAYLYSLANYERISLGRAVARTLNLERMSALLERLGNPHQRYRTLHVAGTKGKGSTSAMLAACLQQLGARVGLYLAASEQFPRAHSRGRRTDRAAGTRRAHGAGA